MDMRDIDELLPKVMPYAPNVPEPVALRHIRDAARKLCDRTRLWKTTERQTITADDDEVASGLIDADVMEIVRARLDGVDLTPISPQDLDADWPDWEEAEAGGPSRYITQVRPGRFAIVPRNAGTLSVRLILKPSDDAVMLPDFLVTEYGTAIGWGALADLLKMPGDFNNPALAVDFEQKFTNRLDTLATRAAKGQQRAPLRTTPRYF